MDPHELALTDDDPSRIFGQPYETGGVTIIPVTRTRRNRAPAALGVYAVKGDKVSWHPAVDQNRIALIGVVTGLVAATLGCVAMVRRPPWPDLHGEIK